MSRSMIAEIRPLPGREDDAQRLIATLAGHVRQEPGNLAFLPYRRRGEAVFEILESYRDEAAFQAHLAQPYVAAFDTALRAVAAGGASIVRDVDAIAPQNSATVRGIDHVGLTVPDIDAADRFLAAAFGAVAIYDVLPRGAAPMAGAETERQLGLPAGARIVHMRLMRIGASASLELFRIEQADQAAPAGIADLGLTHIGIYVDDIAAAARRFEAAGGTLLSPVHGLAGVEEGDGNAGVYGRAPWGTLIELLTYPAGIAYPDDATTTRWTPPPIGE